MRNILRFSALAVLALVAPGSQAASLSYNAGIGCGDTCVTVSLEWVSWPDPIGYVEVDDNFGDFLFGLNTGSPTDTGAILPDPQTISGLSPEEVDLITDGEVITADVQSAITANVEIVSYGDSPTSANLCLKSSSEATTCDAGTEFFLATLASTPEPAAWSLTGGGLALLFAWRQWRRRKFETGTDASIVG
jgi:hypothetical protein